MSTEEKGTSLADNPASTEQEQSLTTNLPSNIDTDVKTTPAECDNKDFHLIKWIEFNYEQLPILLQNVNGPCPLLAIFNILLLRKRVRLPSVNRFIHPFVFP